jgi:hypothetical protein
MDALTAAWLTPLRASAPAPTAIYRTWALLEAPAVGVVYEALLEEARAITDKAMRRRPEPRSTTPGPRGPRVVRGCLSRGRGRAPAQTGAALEERREACGAAGWGETRGVEEDPMWRVGPALTDQGATSVPGGVVGYGWVAMDNPNPDRFRPLPAAMNWAPPSLASQLISKPRSASRVLVAGKGKFSYCSR